jgi:16S rRNA (uracil1498-N3)-methyltransferase
VLARRTEKHLAQSSAKRVERWRRIALEASKQSRRTDIPEIADPTPLKSALEHETAATRILLSETEQQITLTAALTQPRRDASVTDPSQAHHEGWEVNSPAPPSHTGHDLNSQPARITHALAIGPEGGWTPEEMGLFTTHQWQHVTLGPRILRAETAAIAAIAIASAHLGNQPG